MFAQRCRRRRKHGPHWVPADVDITGFVCAGQPSAAERKRLLDEAFGS
jgi:hypothetical protein